MRFRRKRRPRVVWLPSPGTPYTVGDGTNVNGLPSPYENPAAIEFVLQTNAGDTNPVTATGPLVIDNTPETTFVGAPLATVVDLTGLNQNINYGYRLRRIVGDLFVTTAPTNEQSNLAGAVLIQCGIMVRRTNPDDTGQPMATAAAQDVGSIANETDPWVWRRNFVLSSGLTGQSNLIHTALQRFRESNEQVGASAIKVDQKTARRIAAEERLYMTVTCWNLPLDKQSLIGNPNTNNFECYILFSYRVLGTIITNAGNRRNATR